MKIRSKNLIALFLGIMPVFAGALVFLYPLSAEAKAGVIPTCAYSGSCDLCGFIELAINIATFGLGLTGGVTLLFFIYGGMMLLVSFGSRERITHAKKIIAGTFAGMALVFLAWTIVNFTIYAFVGGKISDVKLFGDTQWWKARCISVNRDDDSSEPENECKVANSEGANCILFDGSPGFCTNGTCVYACNYASSYLGLGYSCQNPAACGITDTSGCANIDSCIADYASCAASGDFTTCLDIAIDCVETEINFSTEECIQGACGNNTGLTCCL